MNRNEEKKSDDVLDSYGAARKKLFDQDCADFRALLRSALDLTDSMTALLQRADKLVAVGNVDSALGTFMCGVGFEHAALARTVQNLCKPAAGMWDFMHHSDRSSELSGGIVEAP